MTLINFAAFVPLSTVDDFGYSTAVVFFRGCNLNCWYCHNKRFTHGDTLVDVSVIKQKIKDSSKFVSSVTFSGGESLLQPEALEELIDYTHSLGLKVCLYTSGDEPANLKQVIHKVDRLYIDFKMEQCGMEFENYDQYLRNFIRTLSISEDGSVEVIVTCVVFDTNADTVDEVEEIKCFTGSLMFVITQGIHETHNVMTPEQMKTAFKGCYIRTKENGVEWNG